MGMGRWSRPKAQGEAPSDRCDPAAISQLTVMGQLNLMHENKNRISCHHTRQTEIYTKDEKLSPIQQTEVRKKKGIKMGGNGIAAIGPSRCSFPFLFQHAIVCPPINQCIRYYTVLYVCMCVCV